MKIYCGLMALLLFASCAAPSPQTRIARHGGMYSQLSSEHRNLVVEGQIGKGMSKDAVFLAWGNPARVFQGNEDGMPRERWDYVSSRPVHSTSIGMGYGYYPRYYRNGYACGPYAVPEVTFVPYRSASVWFIDGRVDSWEHEKSNL